MLESRHLRCPPLGDASPRSAGACFHGQAVTDGQRRRRTGANFSLHPSRRRRWLRVKLGDYYIVPAGGASESVNLTKISQRARSPATAFALAPVWPCPLSPIAEL